MKIIQPHFACTEDEDSLLMEWWNGSRSLSYWFDSEGEHYHGNQHGENHTFDTFYAGYQWLVAEADA